MKTKYALASAKRSDAAIQLGGSYRKCSIQGMFVNTSSPNKDYIKRNIEETSGFFFSFFVPGQDNSIKEVGRSPTFQEHTRAHLEAAWRFQSDAALTQRGGEAWICGSGHGCLCNRGSCCGQGRRICMNEPGCLPCAEWSL